MAKESLDSDRLNYLIWRYLVESDYRETALRLQKEWNLQDPQQLPFAGHVTNHALVAILNKGLLYSALERDLTRTNRGVVEPVPGFFGPLTLEQQQPRSPVDEEDLENARKRQIKDEQLQIQTQGNGPAKRPRLSNGYDNELEPGPRSPMDVDGDQKGEGNAYPSPEQIPSPIVTVGAERGTQVDKVSELSSATTFLDLRDDSSSRNNSIVLQCEWNPRDPTILAAAGTDALARMWMFSRTGTTTAAGLGADAGATADADAVVMQSGGQQQGRVFPQHHNFLDEGVAPTTTVTGLAWTSNGQHVAIASQAADDEAAKIEVWNVDGMSIGSFVAFESPIICLRWNPANTLLLALSPDGDGTMVTVMSPVTRESLQVSLPRHSLVEQPLDAAWTSNEEFVLCGGDMLQAFHCVDNEIAPVRKYETREGHALSRISFDWPSRLLATASDTGMIDIWDQHGQCRSFNAHQGLITSLLWQPIQPPLPLSDEVERLLVSAGEDGAISIWNARSPDPKSKSSMTMGSGVVALAFTPDGAFIAGATSERILIWKVDDVSLPRASWVRGSDLGWQTPQSHESAPEEDQHCLCWDANGQKLVYGVNSLLAVIDFAR